MNDYGTKTAPDTLRIERTLPGPIERVWTYLTDPAKRARLASLLSDFVRPFAGHPAVLAWEVMNEPENAAAAVTLVTYSILRRRRGARGPQVSREVGDAARFLDAIERRLRAARVRFRDGEQLEELAVRLSGSRHPLGAALNTAARRYLEARFGGRPVPPNERTALLAALDRAAGS